MWKTHKNTSLPTNGNSRINLSFLGEHKYFIYDKPSNKFKTCSYDSLIQRKLSFLLTVKNEAVLTRWHV